MDSKSSLKDQEAPPSVAWAAAKDLLGRNIDNWEPETFRLELSRRGIVPTDALMAKLLGAQTITTTFVWTYDHDVLFAFALACDGIPAADDAMHHPTVEQLCWALDEIQRLTGRGLDEEEGFDPDAIDPAIAAVALFDGFACLPDELAFAYEAFDSMALDPTGKLPLAVDKAWQDLKGLGEDELVNALRDKEESALNVQLARLADCRRFILAKQKQRATYGSQLHFS